MNTENKSKFKTLTKEEREELFKMVFGPWKERKELNEIVFPNSRKTSGEIQEKDKADLKKKKAAQSKSSSMSQFMRNGKSSDDIEAALKTLLSVAPNMSAFGKDKPGKGEFDTDVLLFRKKAGEYLRRHSILYVSRTIAEAAKAIAFLAHDLSVDNLSFAKNKCAMSALWCGISASLESIDEIPFSLMRDLCKPLHAAISASSKYCKLEVETFHAAIEKHAAELWRHAVLSPAAARESFQIYGKLTGRTLPSELVDEFCASCTPVNSERGAQHQPPRHVRNMD